MIKRLREDHPGWGGISIHVELIEEYGYAPDSIPSIAWIDRYLKENGYIASKSPPSQLPVSKSCTQKVRHFHDRWEMDAQGASPVSGLGYQSMINVKDVKSKIHCMAFPVVSKDAKTKPATIHYCWALRLAFEQWGLPKTIQVDKDSSFRETRSRSPFPKDIHLWLISMGIDLCFIDKPPPGKNSIVERSQQTGSFEGFCQCY